MLLTGYSLFWNLLRSQHECFALPAATAQANGCRAAATLGELVRRVNDEACARSADGVAERDAATVRVDLVFAQAQFLLRLCHDSAEGLVDLGEIKIARRNTLLRKCLLDCAGRRACSELSGPAT